MQPKKIGFCQFTSTGSVQQKPKYPRIKEKEKEIRAKSTGLNAKKHQGWMGRYYRGLKSDVPYGAVVFQDLTIKVSWPGCRRKQQLSFLTNFMDTKLRVPPPPVGARGMEPWDIVDEMRQGHRFWIPRHYPRREEEMHACLLLLVATMFSRHALHSVPQPFQSAMNLDSRVTQTSNAQRPSASHWMGCKKGSNTRATGEQQRMSCMPGSAGKTPAF